MPKTPAKLGDYELSRRISDGAQAAVYEASSSTGEIVALKLFKNTGEDEAAEMRFRREAEILRKLSHRNIVKYRDSFSAEGDWDQQQNCVVMEFMEGHTLKERMKQHPKGMPWDAARDIMEQCLAGLIYAAREHGITHRDIKPSNIFVLEDGHVRLFDFGIARVEGSATATGGSSCMGSFDYMAPDFALADRADPRTGAKAFRGDELSDVFSLTLCFYEMLTGRLPWHRFGERPELEYLARWQPGHMKPPSHSPIAFRVVQHLTGFIDRGLDPDRSSRFPSFEDMLEALTRLRPRTIRHKSREKYILIEGLDKGGFGEVYKARRESDGRVVAMKRLFSDRASKRFVKEADILRKYSHPHLVEYIDSFQTSSASGDKQLFLIMEFLDGMPQWSLRNRIRDKQDPLDVAEVLELFRYYLEAMQYLHENVNQIIHRDIKPGNLYAPKDSTARAKILDLGVARDVTGTKTHGATPGTWDYMAPEFVTENSRGSPASDVYALGLSLYETLSRKPAFPRSSKSGHEAAADFIARATGAAKVPIDYSLDVFKKHPELEGIVRKATRSSVKHRYSTASEMRIDLLRVLQSFGKLSDVPKERKKYETLVTSEGAPALTHKPTPEDVDEKTRASEDWKQWVAAEKSRISSRRMALAALSILTLVVCVWAGALALAKRKDRIGRRREAERLYDSSSVADAGTVKADPASDTGTTSARSGTSTNTGTEAAPVVSPLPVTPPARIDAQPALRRNRTLAQDLVKHLRLLRMRNIVPGSYTAFIDDAMARADNARLVLSQPEYAAVRDSLEVKEEERRLWHHIAENAVNRFINTSDGRFLAAARGALHAATPLYTGNRNSSLFAGILEEWSRLSESVRFDRYLPIPRTGTLQRAGLLKNAYLGTLLKTSEYSGSTAAMLWHAITVHTSVQLGRGRSRNVTQDFVLVPDGKSRLGNVIHPLYFARDETTYGAMRAYRDGAGEDLKRGSHLKRFFSGKISGPNLGQNDEPYKLADMSEAFEFCNWLSHRQGLSPVYTRQSDAWSADFAADGFRLPTGAEWEYAARLGFDWRQAPDRKTWADMERQLEAAHPDSLVWHYYKRKPRPVTSDGRIPYPLGMFDMCGNMGELCMGNASWRNMESEDAGMHVRGGDYRDRTTSRVLPSAREAYERGSSTGFRVVLPVNTVEFLK